MESRKVLAPLVEKGSPSRPTTPLSTQSSPKPLSQHPRSKTNSKLKKSISQLTPRLLRRKPTSFHFFPFLPNELQLLIISFALQARAGELIIAQTHPDEPGVWNGPHNFMSVNRIFREQTQRLRPRAFALVEKTMESALNPLNEILASEIVSGYREPGSPVAPAHVDFDFSRDYLAIPQTWLYPALEEYDVPDLKKLDTLVISWINFAGGDLNDLVPYLCQYPNTKTVALIHEALLNHGFSKLRKNKKRHYTGSGPFCIREDQERERLAQAFADYGARHPELEIPEVRSLRLTRYPKKSWRRPPRGI
jgi:hypothetical protein